MHFFTWHKYPSWWKFESTQYAKFYKNKSVLFVFIRDINRLVVTSTFCLFTTFEVMAFLLMNILSLVPITTTTIAVTITVITIGISSAIVAITITIFLRITKCTTRMNYDIITNAITCWRLLIDDFLFTEMFLFFFFVSFRSYIFISGTLCLDNTKIWV